MGPPTKYNPEYCDVLIDMFSKGKSVAGFCVKHNITTRTFYNWIETHAEFAEAYEIAQVHFEEMADDTYLQQGLSLEKYPNHNQLQAAIASRIKRYQKNAETTTNINITHVQTLSNEELQKKIAQLLERNPELLTHESK